MRERWAGFICGVLLAWACFGAFQDYLGLEGYVTWMRAHWVDHSPWEWALPIVLVSWELLKLPGPSGARGRQQCELSREWKPRLRTSPRRSQISA